MHAKRLVLLLSLAIVSMLALGACGAAEQQPATTRPAPSPPSSPTAVPAAAPTTAPTAAPSPATAPPPGPRTVARERTFIVMQGGADGRNPDFDNFNLFVPGSNNGWHSGPLQTMNEPLIMFNVLTGKHENWLAEDWQYNQDFTEITLKLREGIQWGDGTPFTAEDVAFTFTLVRDHQDKMINTADIRFLKEAVAVDARTVRFVLKEPNPSWWVTTLTSNHGVTEQLLPKHVWKDVQDPLTFKFYDPARGWPFATGPYRLVSTSPEQKVFERRDDWWAVKQGFKQLPAIERVIYIPTRDETTRAQMIIRNELDAASLVTVPTLKSIIAQNPKVITWSRHDPPLGYLDWCPIGLGFNTSEAPWNDRDLRLAINYALDRQKLIDIAEAGQGMLAFHQFTPYEWWAPFEEALKPLYAKYSIDAAAHLDKVEEIMKGKGYTKDRDGFWTKDGQRLNMNIYVPEWLKAYGPPLTTQLQDAGFDATFDTSPGLASLVQTGEQKVHFHCKGPAGVKGMDPQFMLGIYTSQYFRPTGQPAPIWWATSRYQNPDYDAIVEKMFLLSPEDPQTKNSLVQAMDIWFRDMPDIYVSQLIIRHMGNETYWTGWPTKENNYGFLHPWQQEFLKTVINLKPAR